MSEAKDDDVRKQEVRKQEIMKALVHPRRREVLRAIIQDGGPISPIRISKLLGERLGTVSYHVKVLLENEVIELVDTEPRRGVVEHLYGGALDEPWALALIGVEPPSNDRSGAHAAE